MEEVGRVAESDLYFCPWSPSCCRQDCELALDEDEASCARCRTRYPITDGIVEFVRRDDLDAEKRRELDGNTLSLDSATIEHYLNKRDWEWLIDRWSTRKARQLEALLRRAAADAPAVLGAGTGFEVPLLVQEGFRPRAVVVSDLSLSALRIAKIRLRQLREEGWNADVSYCTSDLDAVPLRSVEQDLVVFECLHHTEDMHAALERMLRFGYRGIFLVEPTTNWLIRYFSRRGLAQRIEYSGVAPDRLDVRRVRALARSYGYQLRLQTFWELPVDYVSAAARRMRIPRPVMDRATFALCGTLSLIGRPFRFGNFSVCSLVRDRIAA